MSQRQTLSDEEQVKTTFASRIAARCRAGWSRTKRIAKSIGQFFTRSARATAHGVATASRYTGGFIAKTLYFTGLLALLAVHFVCECALFLVMTVVTAVVTVFMAIGIALNAVVALINKIGLGISLVFATPQLLRTEGAAKESWGLWLRSFLPSNWFGYPSRFVDVETVFEDEDEDIDQIIHPMQQVIDGVPQYDHETGEPLLVMRWVDDETGEEIPTSGEEAQAERKAKAQARAKTAGKGQPTNKQRTRRPRRVPTAAQAAEAV